MNQVPEKKNVQQIRYFSEDFKKLKVQEIELRQITVAKIVTLYDISRSAVYKWINKYSANYQKSVRLVVELESESYKTERLQKRVAELERIIGQKQLEIDLLNKLIEISSEELGVDLKKNISMKRLNGLDAINKSTPGE